MPRLTNGKTGVVVSVSDGTATRLGSDWAAPRAETPDSSWKVADLRTFAETNSIDLGDATKKADILAAINASGDE